MKNKTFIHVILHPINTIMQRKKAVNHPFKRTKRISNKTVKELELLRGIIALFNTVKMHKLSCGYREEQRFDKCLFHPVPKDLH